MLTIHLLGKPAFLYKGKVLQGLATPNILTLFGRLLLRRNRTLTRLDLARGLWPGCEDSTGLHNLRTLIYRLRAELPSVGDYIDLGRVELTWRSSEPCWIDLDALDALLDHPPSEAQFAEAVDLYRGTLLDGLDDAWLQPARTELERRFSHVLRAATNWFEERHRPEEAIRYSERLFALDPTDEACARRLMGLYAFQGDAVAIRRTYRRCAGQLKLELDAAPARETRELYKRLRTAPSLAAAASGPPFTGRNMELVRLKDAWHSLVHPRCVEIRGEPGAGKSRLAAEFTHRVALEGGRVVKVACPSSAAELAFATLAAIFRQIETRDLPSPWLKELSRLVPELLEAYPSLKPPESILEPWQRLRFARILASILLKKQQPLLICIDDLQWCDPETLDWLHAVLLEHQDARVLLVATLSGPASSPRGAQAASRLRSALDRQGRSVHISLSALSRDETFALARHLSGGTMDLALLEHVHRASEGNPLLITRLLQHAAVDSRSLPCARLPEELRDALRAYIDQLSSAARAILEPASALGRSFRYDVLQALVSDEIALVEGLEELLARQLIRESAPDCYEFVREAFREVCYEEMSAPRRMWWQRRLARELSSSRRNPDPEAVLSVRPEDVSGPGDMSVSAASSMLSSLVSTQGDAHLDASA